MQSILSNSGSRSFLGFRKGGQKTVPGHPESHSHEFLAEIFVMHLFLFFCELVRPILSIRRSSRIGSGLTMFLGCVLNFIESWRLKYFWVNVQERSKDASVCCLSVNQPCFSNLHDRCTYTTIQSCNLVCYLICTIYHGPNCHQI